jgi:hypothetical protein
MPSAEPPLHLLSEILAKFNGLDYLRSPHVSSSVYLNAIDEVATLAVSFQPRFRLRYNLFIVSFL